MWLTNFHFQSHFCFRAPPPGSQSPDPSNLAINSRQDLSSRSQVRQPLTGLFQGDQVFEQPGFNPIQIPIYYFTGPSQQQSPVPSQSQQATNPASQQSSDSSTGVITLPIPLYPVPASSYPIPGLIGSQYTSANQPIQSRSYQDFNRFSPQQQDQSNYEIIRDDNDLRNLIGKIPPNGYMCVPQY